MAEMRRDGLPGVIDVRKDAVKRYTEAGYTEVKTAAEKPTAKKSASKSAKK